MTQALQDFMSPVIAKASSKGFPASINGEASMKLGNAPDGDVIRLSGDSYFDPQSPESANDFFDNIDFNDVDAFFDFEPHSGTATPRRQEASSKAPFDFGNAWNGFQPLSPPSSGVLPSDDWQHFGQGQVPHNILTQIDPSRVRTQYGQTTPPDEDMSSKLEYQLAQQQYSLPSPESSSSSSGASSGSKRKQPAADTVESSEVSLPTKRVRKNFTRSLKNGGGSDPNDPEGARRSKFLERNRVAASKCRQKKKEWTQDLENKARELQRHNNELRLVRDSCKEEILFLKGEMLRHTACGCSTIQEYLQRGADSFADKRDAIVKREISPVGTAPSSPAMSMFSNRPSENSVSTTMADQDSLSLQCAIEENLDTLLQPQHVHDTSDAGIARRIGNGTTYPDSLYEADEDRQM